MGVRVVSIWRRAPALNSDLLGPIQSALSPMTDKESKERIYRAKRRETNP